MKRERKDSLFPLVSQVERRCLAERRQERIARKSARRPIDEPLRQLERFIPLVRIEAEHEVGLQVGNVLEDHIDVFGDLFDLLQARLLPRLRLVAERIP